MADANDTTSAAPAAPAVWAPRSVRARRMSRLGVGLAIAGLIASRLGPVLIGIGIFLQVCGVALLGALVCGILALAWGARPVTLPVLAIVALPATGILLVIELFVIFLVTT
jgi:hypothetical protein